jgi:hypothetical protein
MNQKEVLVYVISLEVVLLSRLPLEGLHSSQEDLVQFTVCMYGITTLISSTTVVLL